MTSCLPGTVRVFCGMPDQRHKGPYRKGQKLQATRSWAARVDSVLADNLKAGRSPATRAELARDIGADKTGLMRFLDALLEDKTASSKYVPDICVRLGIDPPLAAMPVDELSKKIGRLTDEDHRRAVEQLVDQLLKK